MAEPLNLLHLYAGEGKGKTTAAMGLALRAVGQGRRVLVAQFLKTGRSGELLALARFPEAHVFEAEPIGKFTFRMTDAERAEARVRQTAQLERLIEAVNAEAPGLMVFDELAMAVCRGLIAEGDAWRLIEAGLKFGEVVVTGRHAPESMEKRADYVSEIKKIRHPFDRGVRARRGIEF